MSTPLPVIVGFGGYNAAGRTSSHQAFRRMVLESLPVADQQRTISGLACLMGLIHWNGQEYCDTEGSALTHEDIDLTYRQQVLDGTLVREIDRFDASAVPGHKNVSFEEIEGGSICFTMLKRDLPRHLPDDWELTPLDKRRVRVSCPDLSHYLVKSQYELAAKAAGQLPHGFKPGTHYDSRFHPLGLQMTIAGISDALHSTGLSLETIINTVEPDKIGTYASSVLGQVTDEGMGGIMKSQLLGKRASAKHMALSLNTMPADFINSYVLGSFGHTEAVTGACATFLYLLQSAVRDITSGKRRIAIVGNSEAGVTPEIMEGFINMGALATEEGLSKLDSHDSLDWRRASRPFGDNCGFTIAESSQFLILMDDALAVELGADIHGSIPGVFINADGIKKSISAPGAGNIVSFARAVSNAMQVCGEETVREHSFVQAHGSSTPANRVTESGLIERVAESFDIQDWPVTATKAYVGHSLSAASGDQIMSALGTFRYGIIPGIKTINKVAHDVFQKRPFFPLQDMDVSQKKMELAFINAKGFGGNNATAVILSPDKTEQMIARRHADIYPAYLAAREQVRTTAQQYEQQADRGELNMIYRYGEPSIDESAISIDRQGVSIPGFTCKLEFDLTNPWDDMVEEDSSAPINDQRRFGTV